MSADGWPATALVEVAKSTGEQDRSLGKGTYHGNEQSNPGENARRGRVRFERVEDDAAVTYWPTGHLVRLELPRPSAAERSRAASRAGGGGLRGAIDDLTAAVRNRQLRRLSMLNHATCTAWCTCTYPFSRRPTGAEFKRHKAKLWDRIRKRWPAAYVVGKREFTERGAIHLHMLVWGVPLVEIAPWLSRAFAEVCGNVDYGHIAQRADVQAVSTGDGLDWYVCKRVTYSGKAAVDVKVDPETGEVLDDPFGRWWWEWGDERPHLSRADREAVDDIRLMYVLRRRAWRLTRYVRRVVDDDGRRLQGSTVDGLPRLSRGMKKRDLWTVHLYADPAQFARLVEFERARVEQGHSKSMASAAMCGA